MLTTKVKNTWLRIARDRAQGAAIDISTCFVEPFVSDGIQFYDVMAYSLRYGVSISLAFSDDEKEAHELKDMIKAEL